LCSRTSSGKSSIEAVAGRSAPSGVVSTYTDPEYFHPGYWQGAVPTHVSRSIEVSSNWSFMGQCPVGAYLSCGRLCKHFTRGPVRDCGGSHRSSLCKGHWPLCQPGPSSWLRRRPV